MKKFTITKSDIKSFTTLSIGFENCEVYTLDSKLILDINCVATPCNDRQRTYFAKDGYIKISSQAASLTDSYFGRYLDLDCNYNLLERLQMMDGAADVTSISLQYADQQPIDIILPYNPICSVLNGCEVDMSNCSSFQIDEDGNMLIFFGASSKQPDRIDNNYAQLIDGWSEHFGNFSPKVLSCKVNSFSTFGKNGSNFSCQITLCNKSATQQDCELVFLRCAKLNLELFFTNNGKAQLWMSQMSNGQIYVGFQNLGIEFCCDCVMEYEHYCRQHS